MGTVPIKIRDRRRAALLYRTNTAVLPLRPL